MVIVELESMIFPLLSSVETVKVLLCLTEAGLARPDPILNDTKLPEGKPVKQFVIVIALVLELKPIEESLDELIPEKAKRELCTVIYRGMMICT